jgi:hypothetical protein
MFPIKTRPVPANTMLKTYSGNGAYVDCYVTEISRQVSFGEYIIAFYTTPLFRLERLILTSVVSKPSTEKQVRQFADGEVERFAAWRVEGRSENEMLLCDFVGRTRSWLMTVPINTANDTRTQLYFGSAVVPKQNSRRGQLSLGFQALLGFHKVYSVLLLYSARLRLQQRIGRSGGKQGRSIENKT